MILSRLLGWLKDFRSGYDIDDLRSALGKMDGAGPGLIVFVTGREMAALKAEAAANAKGRSLLPE